MMVLRWVSAVAALCAHTAFGIEKTTPTSGFAVQYKKDIAQNIKCVDLSGNTVKKISPGDTVKFAHERSDKLIYWEKQLDYHCGKHALNSFFQAPMFSVQDLNAVADEIAKTPEFLQYEEAVGYTLQDLTWGALGNWHWWVLERALKNEGFDVTRMDDEATLTAALFQFQEGDAIVVNESGNHYYTIKNIDGLWYNLDSTSKAADVQRQEPLDTDALYDKLQELLDICTTKGDDGLENGALYAITTGADEAMDMATKVRTAVDKRKLLVQNQQDAAYAQSLQKQFAKEDANLSKRRMQDDAKLAKSLAKGSNQAYRRRR